MAAIPCVQSHFNSHPSSHMMHHLAWGRNGGGDGGGGGGGLEDRGAGHLVLKVLLEYLKVLYDTHVHCIITD